MVIPGWSGGWRREGLRQARKARRFLSRHAKSNGIDADTLARQPLSGPAGLRPLQLPGAQLAALDRRVRATGRLTKQAAEHKRRIKDLARQVAARDPTDGRTRRDRPGSPGALR
jgi:hypothetical protein